MSILELNFRLLFHLFVYLRLVTLYVPVNNVSVMSGRFSTFDKVRDGIDLFEIILN